MLQKLIYLNISLKYHLFINRTKFSFCFCFRNSLKTPPPQQFFFSFNWRKSMFFWKVSCKLCFNIVLSFFCMGMCVLVNACFTIFNHANSQCLLLLFCRPIHFIVLVIFFHLNCKHFTVEIIAARQIASFESSFKRLFSLVEEKWLFLTLSNMVFSSGVYIFESSNIVKCFKFHANLILMLLHGKCYLKQTFHISIWIDKTMTHFWEIHCMIQQSSCWKRSYLSVLSYRLLL